MNIKNIIGVEVPIASGSVHAFMRVITTQTKQFEQIDLHNVFPPTIKAMRALLAREMINICDAVKQSLSKRS